jgi:hypothetical protein
VCLRGAKDSIAAVRADADTDDRPAARDDLPSYLREFLDAYLSIRHRDDPMTGCTVAALSGDAGRGPRKTRSYDDVGFPLVSARLGDHIEVPVNHWIVRRDGR